MHNFRLSEEINDEIAQSAGFESVEQIQKTLTSLKLLELMGHVVVEKGRPSRNQDNSDIRTIINEFLRTASVQERIDAFPGLYRDSLTNALNRRAFEETQHLPVIVMLDLDDFKDINDILGHEVGDETLKAFVQEFQKNLSGFHSTGVYRVGGDEFIFTCSAEHHAEEILRRTKPKIAIEQDGLIYEKEVKYSAGKGSTISEADRALRSVKQAKREAGERRGRIKFSRLGPEASTGTG
ncbi:MAG: GGDEF domain-containing protein [Candidatus Saccharibacteria bacterium]